MSKTNTGYCNTGNRNTGNRNTGYCNTGNRNTGNWNTGNWNTGNWNTGDCNTGNRNTGNWNTGYCNTGNRNTGNWNTGNWNTGNWNTGDCNTGNWNTGYCNTITPDDTLIFNKPAKRSDWEKADKPNWIYDIYTTRWISEIDMTAKEKGAYPSYTTTGGYLKVCTSFHHACIEAWEKASKDDREKTFKLPNYDREVFKEIFGFDPKVNGEKSCAGKVVEIDGKKYRLQEVE